MVKKLFFNQNKYMKKNNFNYELQKEISKMIHEYFKEDIVIPTNFGDFEKEIDGLVLKALDIEDEEKHDKKNMKTKNMMKKHKSNMKHPSWKFKKFIK